MAIPNLIVIGERINPGFKSTKALFDASDIAGIQELAVRQAQAGARYLNVNIGGRAQSDPDFLRRIIAAIQEVADLPLSFDFPNREVQEVCLRAYDADKAKGEKPIVNSISECRWDMLELLKIRPFKVVLMASERLENGAAKPNKQAQEVAAVAKRMIGELVDRHGFTLDDIFVDTSISTLASDTEGLTKMALDGIRLIWEDKDIRGVHVTGGLTNIGIQLPSKAADGSDLKEQVENAFLTLAVPYGFDTVLGTPWKKYELLPEDNFVLQEFRQIVELKGLDALRRVRRLYKA